MTQRRQSVNHGLDVEELFGYCQGIKVDGKVYLAGQVGRDGDGVPVTDSVAANFRRAAENVHDVLERMNAEPDQLAALVLYANAQSISDAQQLMALHREHFGAAKPATTLVFVTGLNDPGYAVEISGLAPALRRGDATMPTDRWNIEGTLPFEEEMGSSSAVKVGRHVYVAGQMAVDDSGEVMHPGDLVAQFELALERVQEVLAKADASIDDVISETIYVTRQPKASELAPFRAAHRKLFGRGNNRPAATRVEVPALALPDALVAVSVVAVLD